jgi:hypothetical protein
MFNEADIAAFVLNLLLQLDQTAVDQVLIQSKEAAFRPGWKPPLAEEAAATGAGVPGAAGLRP